MFQSEEAGPSTPKKKRQVRGEITKDEKSWRKQTFVDSWLQDPNFKGWLSKTKDPYKARCLCCRKDLVVGKSELERHRATPTHKKNALNIKNVPSISSLFTKKNGR